MKTRISCLMMAMLIVSTSLFGSVITTTQDKLALLRGASFFMNYCSGCHSLRYLHYNQLASVLGLASAEGTKSNYWLINHLRFTHADSADSVQTSMPSAEALEWFGMVPPDLSLIAREKGPLWLLSYLKSFYADSSRPFGANNKLVLDTAMPDILSPLRESGGRTKMGDWTLNNELQDLVSFLVYVAEPERETRYLIGIFVISFLVVFLIVVYQLKRTIWRQLP